MSGKDDSLDELATELRNDEYPLPEEREKKEISYKNVDVTIKFRKETENDSKAEGRLLFTDAGSELNSLLFDEAKGVLRVPIVLAKEMIYHYDDYDAFRPADELEAVTNYIKGIPVTRGHPKEKIVTDRGEVMGWAADTEFEDDELRVVLEISDKELISDVLSGKLKGVSPGHFSRIDKNASGEFEGKHYDVTQRDIFIDHIAIVEEGRCNIEDGCGVILNDAIEDKEFVDKKNVEGDEKSIMKGILSKLNAVLKLAEKLEDETLKKKLEELKKAIEEEEEKLKKSDYPKPDGKKGGADEAVNDEATKKLEKERDELKASLDEIVSAEKEKLVDELGSLQEVKTEDELKKMSLDSLKSDLNLVKALRETKVSFDDDGRAEGGTGAIKSAYKEVGKKGGKE